MAIRARRFRARYANFRSRLSGFRGRMRGFGSRARGMLGGNQTILIGGIGAAAGYMVEKEYVKNQDAIAAGIAVSGWIPGLNRVIPRQLRTAAQGFVAGRLLKTVVVPKFTKDYKKPEGYPGEFV